MFYGFLAATVISSAFSEKYNFLIKVLVVPGRAIYGSIGPANQGINKKREVESGLMKRERGGEKREQGTVLYTDEITIRAREKAKKRARNFRLCNFSGAFFERPLF